MKDLRYAQVAPAAGAAPKSPVVGLLASAGAGAAGAAAPNSPPAGLLASVEVVAGAPNPKEGLGAAVEAAGAAAPKRLAAGLFASVVVEVVVGALPKRDGFVVAPRAVGAEPKSPVALGASALAGVLAAGAGALNPPKSGFAGAPVPALAPAAGVVEAPKNPPEAGVVEAPPKRLGFAGSDEVAAVLLPNEKEGLGALVLAGLVPPNRVLPAGAAGVVVLAAG